MYKLQPSTNATEHDKNYWVISKLIQLYGVTSLLRIICIYLEPGEIRDKCKALVCDLSGVECQDIKLTL